MGFILCGDLAFVSRFYNFGKPLAQSMANNENPIHEPF
jgi:hypothetical protein